MVLTHKQRIMAVVVLPLFLMVMTVIVTAFYQLHRAARLETLDQVQTLANQYASLLNVNLREAALVATLAKVNIEQHNHLTAQKISAILRGNLLSNPLIFGSAIAFEPYQYDSQLKLYAPYAYRYHNEIREMDIAQTAYDYTSGQWEWWDQPRTALQPSWGNAYLDQSVGVLMVTYAAPLIKDEKFWGVVTVDISLSQLRDLVQNTLKESMNFFIVNGAGQYVYHPDTSLVINKESITATQPGGDTQSLAILNTITSGQSGMMPLANWHNQHDVWLYYHPLNVADWYFVVVLPQEEIFYAIKARFINAGIILLLGMAFVFLSAWVLTDIAVRGLRTRYCQPVSFMRCVSGTLPVLMIAGLLSAVVYWLQYSTQAPDFLSQMLQAIPLLVWLLLGLTVCVFCYAAMQLAYTRLDQQTDAMQQLLSRIFPQTLVQAMHQYEPIPPQRYARVALLTLEFRALSPWIATADAHQVFSSLKALYQQFDALLKTQNSFYVVAEGHSYRIFSGIPSSPSSVNDESVVQLAELADLAIRLRRTLDKFNQEHGLSLVASLAMHVSDVIGGTLDTAHSHYVVVGSLLPTAQAMAHHATAGTLIVSQQVYEILKFDYVFMPLGAINLGHCGSCDVYQLLESRH